MVQRGLRRYAAVQPGRDLNFPGFVEDHERLLRDAYGSNLDRLREIKARYDPDNLFQGLLNIPPAG